MKIFLFVIIATFSVPGLIVAQKPKQNEKIEQEIRRLEAAEADAVLRQDFAALEKLWAEDFTVNAPNNQVTKGRDEVFKVFRAGVATYSSFIREIESIKIYKDLAITMGLETVKPVGKAPFAGQTVRRRYTNIWLKKKGRWQSIARQATAISQD